MIDEKATMTDQELFEILDDGCWHDNIQYSSDWSTPYFKMWDICSKCGDKNASNPNFDTSDGFFWLWDKMSKREEWFDFLVCQGFFGRSGLKTLDNCMDPLHIINPIMFCESCKKYFSGLDMYD